ncbi:tRNA uridine-5-carboxymethylaminomethyl(34) synthesis GTPase MnmE [Paracoccus aminophilus]|uniref:tRNA modification GTPase MnmE n=1 Tax=Paracoccus aminophilus JCM 7686 TaxID=1367847 RepID=S5XJ23_PARAH|nr:tRNA uridine-5-carboxymethylaminomethyl(34) synthesis GTPase MnmE [Paracoccus aminophilus]AGT07179.1 tRNA modification GTPase TrmE [Paracoccus aminophilus JCM 7686]
MDTIFAEATPPGRGGVSVIRVSGLRAREALEYLAGEVAEARRGYLRTLRDGDDVIDQALVIRFEQDASFTGESVAELQLHGAPVIVQRVETALLSLGLRRAEAGEFTKRAFINGRMDLAEAEGLSDLLAAETEAQRKLAMRATSGEIGQFSERMRALLIRAGALVEASIDFADEDVPEDIPAETFQLLAEVRAELERVLAQYPATERLRQGYEVAIIGPPNAGKSTLLNQIGKRKVALVSDIAGTTRDVIELRTDLKGLPVTFLDTAGLRESDDQVEAMGVALAQERADAADLRIHLSPDGGKQAGFRDGDLLVRAKSDLSGAGISGLTGEGVADLLESVYSVLRMRSSGVGLVSHLRQADALRRAVSSLEIERGLLPEFVAEKIRQAIHEMSSMVGKIGAEEYFDEIFSSFCIGK